MLFASFGPEIVFFEEGEEFPKKKSSMDINFRGWKSSFDIVQERANSINKSLYLFELLGSSHILIKKLGELELYIVYSNLEDAKSLIGILSNLINEDIKKGINLVSNPKKFRLSLWKIKPEKPSRILFSNEFGSCILTSRWHSEYLEFEVSKDNLNKIKEACAKLSFSKEIIISNNNFIKLDYVFLVSNLNETLGISFPELYEIYLIISKDKNILTKINGKIFSNSKEYKRGFGIRKKATDKVYGIDFDSGKIILERIDKNFKTLNRFKNPEEYPHF